MIGAWTRLLLSPEHDWIGGISADTASCSGQMHAPNGQTLKKSRAEVSCKQWMLQWFFYSASPVPSIYSGSQLQKKAVCPSHNKARVAGCGKEQCDSSQQQPDDELPGRKKISCLRYYAFFK